MSGADTQAAFYYQNIVAAKHLLDMVEFGSAISRIVLENPDKGKHIDDIIIYGRDVTRYVQVKWSKDGESSYTLQNLTTSKDAASNSKKPLIMQLADGFAQLERAGEDERAEVVLFSTKEVGTNRQKAAGFDCSLESFLKEFHGPFVADNNTIDFRLASNYAIFKDVLDKIATSSGIVDPLRFSRFLKRLRFELGQDDREALKREVIARLDRLGLGGSRYDVLLNAVVEWSIGQSELRSADVLQRLGFNNHFVDRLAQDFPVEPETCVLPTEVFARLDDALATLPGGFVLLEGPPGAGKSTAITMYREHRNDVALGYYCYIPEETAIGNSRLEHDNFVRAFCIGLHTAFRDLEFPEPFSEYTAEKLSLWLHYLSQQRSKTVLFVDGLDHADQKSSRGLLQRSLITALDGRLPPGILMVLTSQYVGALPPGARSEVESDPRRRITMSRFGYAETADFFRRRHMELSALVLDRALVLTDGVPLYLDYLAEQIADLSEYEQERYLETLPALAGGPIDHYHEHLWNTLDPSAKAAFVLLATRREFTPVEMLVQLLSGIDASLDRRSLEHIVLKHRHLLRTSEARSVSIRHNSFREFILRQEPALVTQASEAILTWYTNHPDSDDRWRHQFRHLYETGRIADLMPLCGEAWLLDAWKSFRPMAEVQENIEFAWRAALQAINFQEFFRISLLAQRAGLLAKNLEAASFDLASMLLDVGRPEEALRAAWDGEKARCEPVAFARLVLHAHRRGIVWPDRIVRAGLGGSTPPVGVEELSPYFAARSLVDPWKLLFLDIDEGDWRRHDAHELSIEPLSAEETAAVKMRLKCAVLEQLHRRRDYSSLDAAASVSDARVAAVAAAMRARLLAEQGERAEAEAMLSALPTAVMPPSYLRHAILTAARYGCDPTIVPIASPDTVAPLELPALTHGTGQQRLDPRLASFYDRLRVRFLLDSLAQPAVESAVLATQPPVRQIFQAIIQLAAAWCVQSRAPAPSATVARVLRGVLQKLDISREHFPEGIGEGELPWATFRSSAAELFAPVWAFAVWALTTQDLRELASEWLASTVPARLSAGVTSSLAQLLHERDADEFASVITAALSALEKRSREDEETSVLVTETLACCAAFGRCGRRADADRLWATVYELGCGIYWRKDYQFNEVFPALRLAHEKSPGLTPSRLARLLGLAHQLRGAAQGRTIAVAVEGLCRVASELVDPALGLALLQREDAAVFRERAMRKLVSSWLKQQSSDLWSIWRVVQTMGRWRDYSEYDEETYPAMMHVFQTAIARRQPDVTADIYSFARRVFLIEKKTPEKLAIWGRIYADSGLFPGPATEDLVKESPLTPKASTEGSPNAGPRRTPSVDSEALFKLSGSSFAQFEAAIDGLQVELSVQQQVEEIQRLMRRVDRLLLPDSSSRAMPKNLAGPSSPESTATTDGTVGGCSEAANAEASGVDPGEAAYSPSPERKAQLREFALKARVERADAVRFGMALIEERAKDLGLHDLVQRVLDATDVERWAGAFVSRALSSYESERLLEAHVPTWIERAPRASLGDWERFCHERLRGRTRQQALLAAAKRWQLVEPARCAKLLNDAWRSDSTFFFESGCANSIIALAFEVDPDGAKALLLSAFYTQLRRYPGSVITHLEQLLRYASRYDIVPDILFEMVMSYAEDLVRGLSPAPTDTSWIENWRTGEAFNEAVIAYLIDLFDYPEVDVRQLAMRALFEECVRQPAALGALVERFLGLAGNAQEHVATIIHSIAIGYPAALGPHVLAISTWLRIRHFNLRETVKSALRAMGEAGTGEVLVEGGLLSDTSDERRVIVLPTPVLLLGGPPSLPRSISRWLHEAIRVVADIMPEGQFAGMIWAHVEPVQRDDLAGMRSDAEVHRHHNINDNFDRLEIEAGHQRALQEAVNRALQDALDAGLVRERDLRNIAPLLRKYDPTDLLVERIECPTYVQWLPDPEVDDERFLSFADRSELEGRFLSRPGPWVTLYEHAEQRDNSGLFDAKHRLLTMVVPFAVPRGLTVDPRRLVQGLHDHRTIQQNRYRRELRRIDSPSDPAVTPLVNVSLRTFRGRDSVSVADVRHDIANRVGAPSSAWSWPSVPDSEKVLQPIEWHGAFDQGRRMHEPISAGFLLQVREDVLGKWLLREGLQLVYLISQRRSVDRYKSESELEWVEKTWAVARPLAVFAGA